MSEKAAVSDVYECFLEQSYKWLKIRARQQAVQVPSYLCWGLVDSIVNNEGSVVDV